MSEPEQPHEETDDLGDPPPPGCFWRLAIALPFLLVWNRLLDPVVAFLQSLFAHLLGNAYGVALSLVLPIFLLLIGYVLTLKAIDRLFGTSLSPRW